MESWPQPTQEEIKFVVETLKGNLKFHFFSKLENPKWFPLLKSDKILWYEFVPGNDIRDDSYSWPAIPYLTRITSEIPSDIYDFFKPLIDKMVDGTIETFWFVQLLVFSIAPKMPDKQFLDIMLAFASYVEQIKSIAWFNEKEMQDLLERLKILNPELCDKLTHGLLTIHLDKYGEHQSFCVKSKYGTNNDYRYDEVLNLIKNLYDKESLTLFLILIDISSKDMYEGVSEEDIDRHEYAGYIHRPAIEDHEQNHQYYETEDKIINALRDLALKILHESPEQASTIFNILENSNRIILTRIAIYLLSELNGQNETLLAKYLTNYAFFDENNYHHEYFHLIKNKFEALSPEHQNIILDYIENGPQDEYYMTDGNKITAADKQKRWKFNKLVPILDKLTNTQKERFQNVIYTPDGSQLEIEEHPDFLTWMGHFAPVIHKSPIEIDDIHSKSITEIIKFMQEWQPQTGNWLNGITRQGFAKTLQEDIKSDPKKYILGLGDFRSVSEPTYIRTIIKGILDAGLTEDDDWIKLIKFCNDIVDHNEKFEDRDPFHDGDKDWYWTKQEAVSVFNTVFRDKSRLTSADADLLESVCMSLKKIIKTTDEHLESNKNEAIKDRLHTAINSLHGQALEALIIYIIWLKNNNKPTDLVLPILNSVISEKRYLEGLAIVARMLPWLEYAIHDWVINSVDSIFPTTDKDIAIFETNWAAFILCNRTYKSMFDLLESKFCYALIINSWQSEEGKRVREHTAQHLAHYYGLGLYSLNSEILHLIFDYSNKLEEQVSFVNYIGFSLWDKDGKGYEVPPQVLQQFVEFWEFFINHIRAHKIDYKKVLVEFERWYQCGRFASDGWAINQLHKLIIDDDLNIKMSCFMLEDNLLKDLPRYTRQVFDIISRLVLRSDRSDSFSRNDILGKTLEYIKNNEFPMDASLKGDKDIFINKLLENAEVWEVEQKTEQFSKYLESHK